MEAVCKVSELGGGDALPFINKRISNYSRNNVLAFDHSPQTSAGRKEYLLPLVVPQLRRRSAISRDILRRHPVVNGARDDRHQRIGDVVGFHVRANIRECLRGRWYAESELLRSSILVSALNMLRPKEVKRVQSE